MNEDRYTVFDYPYLRSLGLAMAGSVSARLVAVATAERGVSSDLKWVLFIIEAACLPGAE